MDRPVYVLHIGRAVRMAPKHNKANDSAMRRHTRRGSKNENILQHVEVCSGVDRQT